MNITEKISQKYKNHWVEKYRPKELEDMILMPELKKKFQTFIDDGDIPTLFFYGSPGTGKTTLAKILIKKLIKSRSDILEMNGSTKGKVETVVNEITSFIDTPPDMDDNIKIVFIDEFDSGSSKFYDAMRETIEKRAGYTRFIVTCNYINKIPAAMKSRFTTFMFPTPSDELIYEKMEAILKNENVEFSKDDLMKIIERYKPDMRDIIQSMFKLSDNGKLNINNLGKFDTKEIQLVMLIKQMIILKLNNNINALEKSMDMVIDNYLKFDPDGLNYDKIYQSFIYNSFDDKFKVPAIMKMGFTQSYKYHEKCALKDINFLDCLFKIFFG